MRDWFEKYKPSPDDTYIDDRFHIANVEYRHAEEFSIDWIQQFSNEEKVEWKWVVDKMRRFLDEHKEEENHKVQKVQGHILRFQGQNHQTVFLLIGDNHKKVQETHKVQGQKL